MHMFTLIYIHVCGSVHANLNVHSRNVEDSSLDVTALALER